MADVQANGITINYDRFGNPDDPTLLMVCGLGMQSIGYDDELIEMLVAQGLDVIRYDNRDVGLSTHLDGAVDDVTTAVMTAFMGEPVDAPYTLSDMAADGMALLDALDVESAHVMGASMGGMIVQTMAIEHSGRVKSMTSVMSTTGEPEVGTPDPDCLTGLVSIMQPAATREERIAAGVELQKLIGTQHCLDIDRVTEKTAALVDRAYDPDGTSRQLLAILASGSRADRLGSVAVPTMVLHGDEDRLVNITGGHRTAELVPEAEFRLMERMGHDMPPSYWPLALTAITDVISRAE